MGLREMEERFSWMTEADIPMLRFGLEPYPWTEYKEVISHTQEWEFQAIEQRATQEEVLREEGQEQEPSGPGSFVGASLAVRSRTTISAFNMVSHLCDAPQATAVLICQLADALPVGAQLDLIVSSDALLTTLGACADILSNDWDIDFYCQDKQWNDLMKMWKAKKLRATVRKVDEGGVDEANLTFIGLASGQVIHTIRHTINGGLTVPMEEQEPESSDQ
jgi:hypothetical protein